MCCLGLGTIFVTARLRIFKGFFMNTFSFFLQYVGETAALINVGSCYELTVMPLCEEQRYGFKYKPCKPWLDSQTVHIGIKVTSTPLHPILNGTRANTIVSVQTSSSFVGIVRWNYVLIFQASIAKSSSRSDQVSEVSSDLGFNSEKKSPNYSGQSKFTTHY